ncbi:MAG TPA: hypothetical protein VN132_04860 [Bdellovibrio sp.]|nr:hypothetical protein [Bdellovibrio sp.]
MKKLISLLAVSILSMASLAQAALPIEGNWGTRFTQNGYVFDATFSIQNNSITLTNVCSWQGRSVKVQVTVPASYDDKTLTTLGSASDERSLPDGSLHCNVSAQAESMNYVVRANQLILSQDGNPQTMVLTRK